MGEKGAGGDRWQRLYLMVIYALCVLVLAGLGFLWARQQGWFSAAPVVVHAPEQRLERPIEINTAKASDLMQVRGIGERRAAEIILLRDNLIHEQKADRKRAKEKRFGYQNADEFLAAVRAARLVTPEVENELRGMVRVEPLPK